MPDFTEYTMRHVRHVEAAARFAIEMHEWSPAHARETARWEPRDVRRARGLGDAAPVTGAVAPRARESLGRGRRDRAGYEIPVGLTRAEWDAEVTRHAVDRREAYGCLSEQRAGSATGCSADRATRAA